MLWRQPTTTLFPYTTLFRSAMSGMFKALPEGAEFTNGGQLLHISYQGGDGNDVVLTVVPEPSGLATLAFFTTMMLRDRKSTRLNSSHRCISYAVFCLKKKKN